MKHLNLTPELYDYLFDISVKEHPVLQELRLATQDHPLAIMQVAPEQAQFMQFLIHLISARRVLELGTFTGYSALAMALALPEDGELITCDINQEWTKNAPMFWEKAGMANKIQLRIAPALASLHALIAQGENQSFDFIFIDADKTNYVNYYELALQLISPKGLIAIDNIFWDGKVIDPTDNTGQTRQIRRLNALIKDDQRVHSCTMPIADGLFLISLK